MPETVPGPTILVPLDASDPGEPSQALVNLLSPHQLVVLGYYPVPDQTATDQARSQFGEEATEAIEAIADRFAESGAGAKSVVVFTHNRSETIDNTAVEYEVDAVLTPGPVGDTLDRILVPLRGDDNLERILGFVAVLLRESDATVTMFNVTESDENDSRGELLVRGACDRLEDEGIDPERLTWRQETSSSAPDAITAAAEDYDLVIVGESEPSLTERILGDVTDRVIDQSSDPLLIVRDH
ncbi:universal stress protein [Salinibaculum salinum]|uniref:universal stress protein n=1 Tax=Salinibaculum salinum TaxID=3131996 RepID=UPI0030EDE508